jgi:hypothetical protein
MTIDDGALICRHCHNAVCLSQGDGTHWRLQDDAMWTVPTPAAAAPPLQPPPGRLRDLARRLGFR